METKEKASEKGVPMHKDATYVWIGHRGNKVTAGRLVAAPDGCVIRWLKGEGDK